MPNIGVVRRSSPLRRTQVRLVPRSLHALILDILQTRLNGGFDAKENDIKRMFIY
jgi:hypothetical protein